MKRLLQYLSGCFVLTLLLLPVYLTAQTSQGPNSPGSASNTACSFAYSSALNLSPASNVLNSGNTYATASHCACCDANTTCLTVSDFGFSIPGNAIINGIVVEIEKKGSPSSYIVDNGLKLLKNGTETGVDKKNSTTPWPSSDTYTSYGGATDLWGASWTAADINSSSFGVVFAAIDYTCAGVVTSSVDHIRVTVYYTACSTSVSAQFSYTPNQFTYNFTDLTNSATSWLWDFGDGNTSSVQNPVHTYNDTGSYTVCLIASDACNSDTICQTITVCAAPLTGYTHTSNELLVSFTDTSTYATAWLWDFGDGNSSSSPTPNHIYADTGTYIVCLYTSNACGTDTLCDTIVVCKMPVADFTSNYSYLTGVFTNNSTNATWWHWDFGDGTTDTVKNPVHIFHSNTYFTICLTVGNACYTDSICKIECVWCYDGITENVDGIFTFSPNPAINGFSINMINIPIITHKLSILDALGRTVMQQNLPPHQQSYTIDVGHIPAGLYILQVSDGTNLYIQKIEIIR